MSDQRSPIRRVFDRSSRGFFDQPPSASGDSVLIVFPDHGPPFEVQPGRMMTRAEFRTAQKIYEVNIGEESLVFHDTVPSAEDGYHFQIHAAVIYSISEAVRVINRGVKDMRSDVRLLLCTAVAQTTRILDPRSQRKAQQEVCFEVEPIPGGRAAERLERGGYALSELQVTVRRDKRLLDNSTELQNLTLLQDLLAEQEKVRKIKRLHEVNEVEHLKQFLNGGLVTRLARLAMEGPKQLEEALTRLSSHELDILQKQMQLVGQIAPNLEEHVQQKLFEQLRDSILQWLARSEVFPAQSPYTVLVEQEVPATTNTPTSTS